MIYDIFIIILYQYIIYPLYPLLQTRYASMGRILIYFAQQSDRFYWLTAILFLRKTPTFSATKRFVVYFHVFVFINFTSMTF